MWMDCLHNLSTRVTKLILRIEQYQDSDLIYIKTTYPDAVIIEPKTKWNRWNWREELLQQIDSATYVLFPDQDETFDSDFEQDFQAFIQSSCDCMMFKYKNPTFDNAKVDEYPKARHMKAFRWKPGLTYTPYIGYARLADRSLTCYPAKSKMNHWCFCQEELRSMKEKHL
jgi:hypothetical protein